MKKAYFGLITSLVCAASVVSPGIALANSETPVPGEYTEDSYVGVVEGSSSGETKLYITCNESSSDDDGYDVNEQMRRNVSVPASAGAGNVGAAASVAATGTVIGATLCAVIRGRE